MLGTILGPRDTGLHKAEEVPALLEIIFQLAPLSWMRQLSLSG